MTTSTKKSTPNASMPNAPVMPDPPIMPDPQAPGLTSMIDGIDASGAKVAVPVVAERPMTIFLNSQEIITAMTLGDWLECMAVGFLCNQGMLRDDDVIEGIDIDDDLGVIVVRTQRSTDYEAQMQSRIRTSGCAQGTVFGALMDRFNEITLNPDVRLKTSTLMRLTKAINTTPSLYLAAGAIHGCVLACDDEPLVYMEDVGRHNAVDKIAGWMFLGGVAGRDKVFYTTGRLTSEMVIKTVQMEIPVLISRSGFTASGVELARQAGLTLIGRARGKRFTALSGFERIIHDADMTTPEAGEAGGMGGVGDTGDTGDTGDDALSRQRREQGMPR